MSTINIRTDEKIKKQAEKIFEELGLNLSTAINVFLRQSIRAKGLPFDVKLEIPNQITAQAIEEGQKIAADKSVKGYKDIKDLRSALGV